MKIANTICSGTPTTMIHTVFRIACQKHGSFVNMYL